MTQVYKRCKDCKQTKLLDEFHKHNTSKDGHSGRCKTCATAHSKRWYQKNRESKLEELRGDKSRNAHYMRRYKLTLEDYILMSVGQNHICANPNCNAEAEEQRSGNLFVDHDRACCPSENTCGKCVRGLLCDSCNKALGFLNDDLDKIKGLIMYLEEYSLARGV